MDETLDRSLTWVRSVERERVTDAMVRGGEVALHVAVVALLCGNLAWFAAFSFLCLVALSLKPRHNGPARLAYQAGAIAFVTAMVAYCRIPPRDLIDVPMFGISYCWLRAVYLIS